MHFLGDLAMERHAVGRLGRERNEARPVRRRERCAVAAVDVAVAERLDLFETGDRDQFHVVEVPDQARIATVFGHVLEVLAVERDLVALETRNEIVAARIDDVRAEQDRRAVEVQRMHVEQRMETVGRLPCELQARGAFVVAAETVAAAGAVLSTQLSRCWPRIDRRADQVSLSAPPIAPSRFAVL
jgi:hypothetical protein